MKLKEPLNKNYCATVVKIDKFIELENCDNVKHAIILGNSVIVSKSAIEGVIGLYFPLETKLSEPFLSENNLYRHEQLNSKKTEKGYFEDSGRVKCAKFRGHKSEGFYIPLHSLTPFADIKDLATLKVGDEFDHINGVKICEKYVVRNENTPSTKTRKSVKRISRLVDNQFRLHTDTAQLKKNITSLRPTDIISLTYKLHGTSFVVGNVLTKLKLSRVEKVIKWLSSKIKIKQNGYDLVYASRRVVKNEFETQNSKHYFSYDFWAEIKDRLKESVEKGITIYGEAVGYLKDGAYIQKDYDYSCKYGNSSLYVYRITSTNEDGKVIQFTRPQLEDYCRRYGLNPVPLLYYGRAGKLFPISEVTHWHDTFVKMLENNYLEKDCYLCENKVPLEGIVVEKEMGLTGEAFKLKSFRFLERETKLLDEGEVDIESADEA